jgi:hypothetical protein
MWGSSYLAVKLAGTGLGPISFVAIRLAVAIAFLVAVAVVMRGRRPQADARAGWAVRRIARAGGTAGLIARAGGTGPTSARAPR